MSETSLFFALPDLVLEHVVHEDTALILTAHPRRPRAECPQCGQPSARIHSRYTRSPRDLPMGGQRVRLLLHVRRFFCDRPSCPQRTFAERLPRVVPVRGQRTERLTSTLSALGQALGGEAGARMGSVLSTPVSAATLLRIVRRTASAVVCTPRVVGVDDFALRKGRVYGTIVVDLERHRPVDLLPDRTADTVAAWLRAHPGVEIVTRDRSTEYAHGATLGAPTATQVADRWHLLVNLREALERLLSRLHARLRRLPLGAAAPTPTAGPTVPATRRGPLRPESPAEQVARRERRARRDARYQEVHVLRAQGLPLLQIARRLGMSRTTVRLFAHAETFPERAAQRAGTSRLTPHMAYLERRWAEGCQTSSQLWREIRAQGYPGTRKQVARWAQQHRQTPAPTTPTKYIRPGDGAETEPPASPAIQAERLLPLNAPRRLVWLLLRDRAQLEAADLATLLHISQDPTVTHARTLARQFQQMVRRRTPAALEPWLSACGESDITELRRFAAGLRQDYAAIEAALTEPWSNGQVEGQITRVKFLKRSMYGRAKFDLLRHRVLHAA